MTTIKMKGNALLGGPGSITAERAKWQCVDERTGKVLKDGDTVTDFRGDTGAFNGLTRPPMEGKSAKISVDGREYYDRVFSVRVELKPGE